MRSCGLNRYSRQQFGLHGGASEGGHAPEIGSWPFETRPAEALISLSSFLEPQSGQAGFSLPRTSSSNSESHFSQEYSKIGMDRSANLPRVAT